MSPRRCEFRLLGSHGRGQPQNCRGEAQIQRQAFRRGSLCIQVTENNYHEIRLLGYEVPLETGTTRVRCLDLIGYDSKFRPWLIELKRAEAHDSISDVIEQLRQYADLFSASQEGIVKEVQKKLFWAQFRFAGGPCMMVLAPRRYFTESRRDLADMRDPPRLESFGDALSGEGTAFCSFAGIRNGAELKLAEANRSGPVSLRIINLRR
jgi:hypothetical protein